MDPYATLRVPRTATAAEIKKAYKQLALQYHPDKNPEGDRAACEVQFKAVSRAYEILSNEDTRRRYDQGGLAAVDASAAAEAARRPGPTASSRGSSASAFSDRSPPPASSYPGSAPSTQPRYTGAPRDVPMSPFHAFHFHFTDPFELFNAVFADSPLTPHSPFFSPFGFGSPLAAGGGRQRQPSWGDFSLPDDDRRRHRESPPKASHDVAVRRREMVMDPFAMMDAMFGSMMGGGLFGGMDPFGGPSAVPDPGFFSADFATFASGGSGGARSFSSETVVANGRARTRTVKRYTDHDGRVHEERNETEGAARLPRGSVWEAVAGGATRAAPRAIEPSWREHHPTMAAGGASAARLPPVPSRRCDDSNSTASSGSRRYYY